jgi:hypothetical protein
MTTTSPYKIFKNSRGERFFKFSNNEILPADLAGLCGGKDLWISEIQCKCLQCGDMTPVKYMTGNGRWCEECAIEGIE